MAVTHRGAVYNSVGRVDVMAVWVLSARL